MSTAILIPARLQSSRFPNKMLCELNGKTLIEHVYDICNNTILDTYVLTDSKQIYDIVPNAIMTGEHENGTARCMSVIDSELNYEKYINVQGDMPDITADMIYDIESLLNDFDIVTAYTDMSTQERMNPNSVKVIHTDGVAHWFCRASLKYGDHHLGIYGYTKQAKYDYNSSKKYKEEDYEMLEQLRWIQNGYKIGMVKVDFDGIEINTPEDLVKWKNAREFN